MALLPVAICSDIFEMFIFTKSNNNRNMTSEITCGGIVLIPLGDQNLNDLEEPGIVLLVLDMPESKATYTFYQFTVSFHDFSISLHNS